MTTTNIRCACDKEVLRTYRHLLFRFENNRLHACKYPGSVTRMHAGVQVRTAMYGCDCYAYGLLATGTCDLVVEADMKPYDYMALVPIVQGAGGVMTDWEVLASIALSKDTCALSALSLATN